MLRIKSWNELKNGFSGEFTRSGTVHPGKGKDVFTRKITIYNDIPSDGVNPRRFHRAVVEKCFVYNDLAEQSDGTVQRVVNAQNVITKDTARYLTPLEYVHLSESEREGHYTAQVDDFVVLAEVDDVVTSGKEFQLLQQKYKDNGFSVTSVNASVYGFAVDNIHIMHA